MSPGDGAQALVWTARLLVMLPALAALLGAFVARPARRTQSASGVAGAGVAVLLAVVEVVLTRGREVVAVPLLGPVETGAVTVHLDLRADRLSAVVALMVAVVALCVQVYSVRYQETDPRHRSYVATVQLFTTAMLLVVHADDLLLLLIGWEAMGLCSYLLVGHESERTAARAAAVKAFLVTRVGDVGFLLGVVVLLAAAGTTSISTLLDPAVLGGLGGGTITAAVLLLTLGVLGKSAQLPLHTWLPDAMEGPTPVSALIHAATMVAAGGYVLARLLPLAEQAPAARAVLAVVTALTMLVAALVALAQTDLKRVLAWSTISQVAYLLAALAVTPPELGAAPGVVQLLSHAGFKALLFLAAGALAHQVHSTALDELAGAWRRAPLVAVALTVGLASLAGVPPLSGYWSKEGVLGAAEEATHGPFGWAAWLVLVSGLLTGLVTAAYATRTWLLVVRDVPAAEPPVVDGVQVPDETVGDEDVWPPPVAAVPGAMLVPLAVLAVPALLGGLLLLDPVVPGQVHVGLPTALVAAGRALLGVVAALAA
ncbi:NADH-quinone oxidoreductase subunit 5 family protein, partial [Angustibacter aerolatus]